MDQRVREAMAKWPNVPALFGWLRLDRRGRWLLRGEPIARRQITDFIARNYEADPHGRWFFQNGPQRVYVALDYAPLILRAQPDGTLLSHCDQPVRQPAAAYLDEDGSLLLESEHGPALLDDADLEWALARLVGPDHAPVDEAALATALAQPSGARTALSLQLDSHLLAVDRLDAAAAPARLAYQREPTELPGR